MLFHQDIAPIHASVIAVAKINELKFELLPHAPCSSDLAPSDYFLFPNLKKWLDDKRFANNEEVESTVDGNFEEPNSSHYKQGIEAIKHRWEKCIKLKADYVEKKQTMLRNKDIFFQIFCVFLVRSGTSGTTIVHL